MKKQLTQDALAKAIDAETARLAEVAEKARTKLADDATDAADLKAAQNSLHNVKQRTAWLTTVGTMHADEIAAFSKMLPNWAALVAPSDLYDVRDAAYQFVQASLGRGKGLRTAFRDFLEAFTRNKADTLPTQRFRGNVLRTVSGESFYTGDTAIRWARGCARGLSLCGEAARIEGRGEDQRITLNPKAPIFATLAEQGLPNVAALAE